MSMVMVITRMRSLDDVIKSKITLALSYDLCGLPQLVSSRKIPGQGDDVSWASDVRVKSSTHLPRVFRGSTSQSSYRTIIRLRSAFVEKYIVTAAFAMAVRGNEPMSLSRLSSAMLGSEEIKSDYHNAGIIANLGSYA